MRLDEASLSLCVLNPQYQLQPLWTWSNQQCVSEEMSCQVTARLHLGFLFVCVCGKFGKNVCEVHVICSQQHKMSKLRCVRLLCFISFC